MTIKRKFLPSTLAAADGLGARQVRVIISTDATDRAGDVVRQEGIDATNFLKNPIVLWNHKEDAPVARCLELVKRGGQTEALVEFYAEGLDPTADRICKLVKAGAISGVSVGFNPLEVKPLASGGFEFSACELLEFSFVSIPAQADALVVQRSAGAGEASPVAIRVTGPMTDEQRKRLAAMWTAYKSGTGPLVLEPGWKLVTRSTDTASPPKLVVKSLYDVAWMADLLRQFGYLQSDVAWEAALEEDASPVPGMLAAAMNAMGEALVAMTTEEVAELLARVAGEDAEPRSCPSCGTPCVTKFCGSCGADCSALLAAPVTKATAVARAKSCAAIIKAGRVLSAANASDIKAAVDLIEGAAGKPDEASATGKAARERRVKALRLAIC